MKNGLLSLTKKENHPDFLDLPWHLPLDLWMGACDRLEEVQTGVSRHAVCFVNYGGSIYALKELPAGLAAKEYQALQFCQDERLPVVDPVGYANVESSRGRASILITCFLEHSIPYHSLFMQPGLLQYRDYLLDAVAGLIVQLHLKGIFWGDCSLSNTLFRRDAGTLQAYLVDAETAEILPVPLPPALRAQELDIMEENISGGIADLRSQGYLPQGQPISDTAAHIRLRYQQLWQQTTQDVIIHPSEHYRIQERIRALNDLGFSVRDVELHASENGDRLRMRVAVTDRNFHRDQLHSLTGLTTGEMQARQLINEINELKATLSQAHNRSTPLSVAAYHWLRHVFKPVIDRLNPLVEQADPVELYCQVLEHKWYLSEQARHDVGHQAAVDDFLRHYFPHSVQD